MSKKTYIVRPGFVYVQPSNKGPDTVYQAGRVVRLCQKIGAAAHQLEEKVKAKAVAETDDDTDDDANDDDV